MDHWRQTSLPMREVCYEGRVAEPAVVTSRLLAHLGLAWEPACLSPEAGDRTVRTASYQQFHQPIYRHAAGRWRHDAHHLEPLRATLGALAPPAK